MKLPQLMFLPFLLLSTDYRIQVFFKVYSLSGQEMDLIIR